MCTASEGQGGRSAGRESRRNSCGGEPAQILGRIWWVPPPVRTEVLLCRVVPDDPCPYPPSRFGRSDRRSWVDGMPHTSAATGLRVSGRRESGPMVAPALVSRDSTFPPKTPRSGANAQDTPVGSDVQTPKTPRSGQTSKSPRHPGRTKRPNAHPDEIVERGLSVVVLSAGVFSRGSKTRRVLLPCHRSGTPLRVGVHTLTNGRLFPGGCGAVPTLGGAGVSFL